MTLTLGTSYAGLSPRLRGNLRRSYSRPFKKRSIPAPAGEPNTAKMSPNGCAVYPRACGGTATYQRDKPVSLGLSPRLRGNLGQEWLGGVGRRSIPAPAGEP